MPTWKRTASGSRKSALLIAIGAAASGASAYGKPTPSAPPILEVLVTKVTQRGAPIYSQSVGTQKVRDGMVAKPADAPNVRAAAAASEG